MRIRLLRRYDADAFPFGRLKEEYGICALRGAQRGAGQIKPCAAAALQI